MNPIRSKFASWSLVASALILAAGIVVGTIILRASRTAPAGTPQFTAQEAADVQSDRLDKTIASVFLGWTLRDVGMSLYNATNRVAIRATNPAAVLTIRETLRQQVDSGDLRYNLYFPNGTRPPE